MQTKFTYTIQDTNNLFADDIPSRSLARQELKEVKSLGYSEAKIIREEWVKLSTKAVR